MIRLNKIASAVLAGTLALSLAACSGDTASSSSAADTSSASTGDTAASGELAEDVQAIVDRGVLRVGVKSDVIGFGYLDPLTNEYSGLEIDLAQKLADSLGVDIEYNHRHRATRGQLIDLRRPGLRPGHLYHHRGAPPELGLLDPVLHRLCLGAGGG